MEKEEVVVMLMFGLVGLTTVFIVFVVFYMIVSHKTKDIGILKSVGVSSGDVVGLFLCFAFLVGILGSAIGTLGGWDVFAVYKCDRELALRAFRISVVGPDDLCYRRDS